MSRARGGFTLIEVGALIVTGGVGAAVVSVCQPLREARATARQLKDQTQVRGIHQSMVVYAGSNRDLFPLPSEIEKTGETVDAGQVDDPSLAPRLDSTRNIFSILVMHAFNTVEQFVSPSEANGQIEAYAGYQFDEPAAAAGRPVMALWDPAFRATPEDTAVGTGQTADSPGGFSYAHAIPLGERREMWGNTFGSSEAALGNRGPSYELTGDATDGVWSLVQNERAPDATYDKAMGTTSYTLLIHGTRDAWEGNVVMNDNACYYFDEPAPRGLVFTFEGLGNSSRGGLERPDNLFVRENDGTRMPAADALSNDQVFGIVGEPVKNNFLRSYAGGPGMVINRGTPEARTWMIDVFLD